MNRAGGEGKACLRAGDSAAAVVMVGRVKRFVAMAMTAACCLGASAAEKVFEFTAPEGKLPEGWTPVLAGKGMPGNWKIVFDEVPPILKPLTAQAPKFARREVLAQVSADATDERFPLLVYEGERYQDFTARLRFKLVSGAVEQMAGLIFRMQDEKNFYVARGSGSGNVRFYKFVNGVRSAPIGPELPVSRGDWHELVVKCLGNSIDLQFDGKAAMPTLTDNSHLTGRIGLFTKSDAISYFSDLRIDYRPVESLAETLLKTTLEAQPRLLDLKVYGRRPGSKELVLLSAKTPGEKGKAAGDVEVKVLAENRTYYSKGESGAVVTHPLHDRNGEPIGVARFVLKTYKGQMEAATIGRVLPLVKDMEQRIGAASELTE